MKPIKLRTKVEAGILVLLLIGISASAITIKFGNDGSGVAYSKAYDDNSDFVVWKEGTTYYSKNGTTGIITSGSNATNIIQGCIDYIEANNDDRGGEVFIREGNYTINYNILPSGNVTIRGVGKGTVLYAAGDINIIYFEGNVFPDDRGLHLDNLCFKSSFSIHNSAAGVKFNRVHHFCVTNCWFEYLYNGLFLWANDGDVDNGWIFGNHFYKIDNFCIVGTASCEENAIVGNIIDNYEGTRGISYSGSHSTITGNTVEEVWGTSTGSGVGDGMYITGTENVVSGNTVRESGRYNIVVGGNRNIFSNNIVDDCYGGRGFSIEGSGHRILGNVVTDNGANGIYLISGSGSLVSGNFLSGHTNEINLVAGSVNITDNTIDNDYHFNFQTANASGDFRAGFAWYDITNHKLYVFEGAGVWKSTTFT